MSIIDYKNGTLFVENVNVTSIANSVDTPFYCYSTQSMIERYKILDNLLNSHQTTIYYAVKANSNVAVIRTMAEQGAGADVVSVGELQRCLLAGMPANKIVFSGVGKTREEIAEALREGVFQLNAESVSELHAISEVATSLNVTANLGLRVNPDVDAKTHAKITTGRKENKFGIDLELAPDFFKIASSLENISLKSLAVHIGSQLLDLEPYRIAYKKLADMTTHLRELGFEVDHLDLGGGLGISYKDEILPDLNNYNNILNNTVGHLGCKLGFEPGRFLVGESGILVTKVIYIKMGAEKRFVIVDGAMNDLIRPTLYEGYHEIIPVNAFTEDANSSLCDVVGPVCESGDYLARNRMLPCLSENDLLAVKSTGAYGAVMSSTYNSRPLVPEILVKDDAFSIIRKRQTIQDVLQLERTPHWV